MRKLNYICQLASHSCKIIILCNKLLKLVKYEKTELYLSITDVNFFEKVYKMVSDIQ